VRHLRRPKDRGGLDFGHDGPRIFLLFNIPAPLRGLELGGGVAIDAGAVLRALTKGVERGDEKGGNEFRPV